MKLGLKMVGTAVAGLVFFGVLLFLPAATFNYWQAWLFIAVFAVSTWIPSIYLLRTNPAALQRRMRAGPAAETRTLQKIVIAVAFLSMAAMIVLSALDHRFGWSRVPVAVSLFGDVLVAIGLGIAMFVVIQNGYAAANVAVEKGQRLVSKGLYGFVRHPMYVGNLVLMVGIPVALGSYWGLLFVIPGVVVLVVRILDEEQVLEQQLTGYREYTQSVHYRLVPYVW
ncbi:isoprenylcysteine carboxylmethyltransferase family protein [Mycobacterium sp.]|jgi:protein-S-isoprenylcysteine O-methyltransferase Ste14|uniref:methyltransferase family protein n=1 Tax=Mycobacterium sp. TaxID=1785 RepID=UPI002D2C1768|nr:isoprenylcysteine carboxylmethyltransferase family protein [Mycobacterium sp.]HZA11740.1 isoprenylcysteine carboxylmethyltransferase family protein [Mycobacterium sp.]